MGEQQFIMLAIVGCAIAVAALMIAMGALFRTRDLIDANVRLQGRVYDLEEWQMHVARKSPKLQLPAPPPVPPIRPLRGGVAEQYGRRQRPSPDPSDGGTWAP